MTAAAAVAIAVAGVGAGASAADPAGPALPQAQPSAQPSGSTTLRNMLLVGNNWEGTVDVIDPRTLEGVARINVAPDFEEVVANMTPDQQRARQLNNEFAAEGHDQLVDDIRISPDGRTLYASRPSLGDAVALDLTTGEIIWRRSVMGYRSDHIALSPDGNELLVSATVGNVIEVLNAHTGALIDQIPTGDFPHENEYSHDGELIFNGSIGRVITPDFEILDPAKGNRWLTIADAQTHEVIKVVEFDAGVRPYQILGDNRTAYIQLSFFHGFIEFDLQTEQVLRTVNLPLSEEAQQMEHSDYPLDSAHHGLAMNEDETKICDAATVSDYVAIVDRSSLTVDGIVHGGDMPYWATASADGEYCFVANSKSDDVSVVTFHDPEEVARLPVGDHPQRMRVLPMIVPHLKLIVKPRRVERGDRTKLRFKVRSAGTGVLEGSGGAFGAVEDATVHFGKKEAETGPRGFATIRARFKRRGHKKVFADASGYAGGEAKVRVRKPD